MGSVQINVRGSHSVTVPSQRATVHASVSHDGPVAEPVFASVTEALARVRASVEALYDPDGGPVNWYAIDQVRVGSHRPWNADGEQLPRVYTAAVSLAVRFSDFDALGRWVGATAASGEVAIGTIDWTLTRRTRAKLERKTRQEALRDAQRRAQDYADALDLGTVRVVSVSDPGLGPPMGRTMVKAVAMSGAPEPAELSLRPEDIEVGADVEATFTVARR